MFLGLNLVLLRVNYLLLVSLSWNYRGLCKQTVIGIFNQCKSFTFSFLFFLKEKGSHGRDSDSVQIKSNLCGIWGDELCHKNKDHAGMCNLVTIKKGSQ